MARMLIAKTGKALLERRMARKRGPEYADYVARTSGLIPRPPRKRATPRRLSRRVGLAGPIGVA